MIIPPYLMKGDRVGIVSTARKITRDELKPAIDLLGQWGLVPVLGNSIGVASHQFAGDDTLRTNDFQQMLDDPAIRAIWCARGGYGTVRIIDRLDFGKFITSPKWIIGYSDITVLHAHLNRRGVATLHAQMALEIEKRSPETANSLQKAMAGQIASIAYQPEAKLKREGVARGKLVGGNLSVLYSLCGSDSALHTDGCVLFLEDLDEYLYHVDRMIQNLRRNGMLAGLAGLIVGGMTDMNDNSIPFGETAEQIIWHQVKDFNYPVCFGFPAGHTYENRALLFGSEVELNVGPNNIQLSFNNVVPTRT